MMRIITGKARGVRLKTLEGDATRPTGERCKEALFSMIQFDIEGREVLDLYAGSGQLGLEALSRGAASATFVDKSKQATGIINENIIKTKLLDGSRVICSDVTDFIRTVRGRKKYDISLAATADQRSQLIRFFTAGSTRRRLPTVSLCPRSSSTHVYSPFDSVFIICFAFLRKNSNKKGTLYAFLFLYSL